jgi:hypothetical protein
MPYRCRRSGILLVPLVLLLGAGPAVADIPSWLPRYDLDIHLDVAGHVAHVHQRVTWTNRHERPAEELVFNAHSHYQVPDKDVGFMAKMLELLRMDPGNCLALDGSPFEIRKITLGRAELKYRYREDCDSILEVPLPRPVAQGESVTIDIEFDFHLPPKMGRWGQWNGVTYLSNWLPVVAYYDNKGWQPTPYIPWHQPFFNEAGVYTGRLILPCDQQVACSTSILARKDLGDGTVQLDFTPRCTRDFAIVCSARFHECLGQVGGVQVRCLCLPEHEHYGQQMVRFACEALPYYSKVIGPYPYPDFTIVESYFAWLGNECGGGLVMIEERVFGMPHLADGYVEYLISHELCHQWWYNLIGTNGYCETWMDEAWAVHYTHRLLDLKHGHNNNLLHYPSYLEWLPNIRRDDYRYAGLFGILGRGDTGPCVQEMPKFRHLANLLSLCYDRGGKVVDMIEERMGEAAFCDFIHIIYNRYQYRILRVADFQRELEAYTGQSWEEFFQHWLYGAGCTDWSVEHVKLEPQHDPAVAPGYAPQFLEALRGHTATGQREYKVTVLLHQKGEYTEPTTLGICLNGGDGYQIRIPIDPHIPVLDVPDPPAHVEVLSENRVRVEVVLPCKPTQITVDPDQLLLDSNPANNYWKPKVRFRFCWVNTMLDEADYTNCCDRWNVTVGPGVFFPTHADPWYERATVVGLRGELYRTQEFDGGAYVGYRADNRDIVAGVDGLWDHWPVHHTQIGFNVERSLTYVGNDDNRHADRGVIFGRYVFEYGDSLYLPPMHYVDLFATIQDYTLPQPSQFIPGADHFDHQTAVGLHHHLDLLTPYWNPAGGFRIDTTYTNGLPILGEHRPYYRLDGQLFFVQGLPVWLGPLAETRLAVRLYGAGGLPSNGEYYPLGGMDRFRGFDLSERQGSVVWGGTLEWRVPVARQLKWDYLDHFIGVRTIYVAPFYDVGDAYVSGHSYGPVAHALGAGLRVDVAWFGFVERSTLRFDVAKTINVSSPVQFWVGVEY